MSNVPRPARDGETLSDERLATLRKIAYRDGDLPWEDARLLFNAVAALRAECALMRDQRDEYHDERDASADECKRLRAECAAAKQEIERLTQVYSLTLRLVENPAMVAFARLVEAVHKEDGQ